jgi:hypothetical protein
MYRITKIILAALAAFALCGSAIAQQPSGANLLTDFSCPGTSCTTTCVGTGGTTTINAKDVKVFQFSKHPRRVWLLADGQVHLLGDDDRCHFGGATTINFENPPIESVPLNPPRPACTCIGNQCTPPGCGPVR